MMVFFFKLKMISSFDSIVVTANEQRENKSLLNSMSREIGGFKTQNL